MAFMELSSVPWTADLMDFSSEVDDPYYTDHLAAVLGDSFRSSFSSGSYTSYPTFASFGGGEDKTFSCSSVETSGADQVSTAPPAVSSPSILSFGNTLPVRPKGEMGFSVTRGSKRAYETAGTREAKKVCTGTRPPVQAHDHIIAERKRREKLSQKFIALSALVPGLKKMDKASVLSDAIKYVRQLQERVTALEDQSISRTVESAVLVRRSILSVDEGNFSSGEETSDDSPLPEIEAKICEKNVLVRVHCEKRKGLLVRLLTEIEKLHLFVISSSSVPFASSALDITVTAQVEDGFSITVKDLVKRLTLVCSQLK